MSLHMLRFTIRLPNLYNLVRRHAVPTSPNDLGYFMHCGFEALWDGARPFSSFKIERTQGDKAHILAYSEKQISQLQSEASIFAEPDAYNILEWDSTSEKTMPVLWRQGLRLGFQVLVCPTTQLHQATETHRAGAEVDHFLLHKFEDRAEAYTSWLKMKMKGVELEHAQLDSGAIQPMLRRTHNGPRSHVHIEKPVAQLSGVFTICDPDLFQQRLLNQGVGRHRAFGLGMLLLKQPSTSAG